MYRLGGTVMQVRAVGAAADAAADTPFAMPIGLIKTTNPNNSAFARDARDVGGTVRANVLSLRRSNIYSCSADGRGRAFITLPQDVSTRWRPCRNSRLR